MKKLILILLFACQTFATNWYVRPITGEYGLEDGTSWGNAFDGFTDIAWASINAGDTLFISGGADTAFYYQTLTMSKSGTSGNEIVVTVGNDAGHNGLVYIDGQRASRNGVTITGSHTILDGQNRLEIWRAGYDGGSGSISPIAGGLTNVTITRCYVNQTTANGCIRFGGASGNVATDIKITYNTLIGGSEPCPAADQIVGAHTNGVLIDHNIIISDRYNGICATTPCNNHDDNIQFYHPVGNFIISNNYMYDHDTSKCHQMIMSENCYGTNIYYNNVFYMPNKSGGNVVLDNNFGGDPNNKIYYAIHNTLVGGTNTKNFSIASYHGHMYNNIFQSASYGGGNVGYTSAAAFQDPKSQIQGNLWGDNFTEGIWDMSLTTMNNNGAETFGNPSSRWRIDPLFVNGGDGDEYPNEDFRLQINSPARDGGIYNIGDSTLQDIVEAFGLVWEDIDGNPRDDTPDIGAYEFTSEIDTIPTFSFTPVTNAELNSYHIGSAVFTNVDSTFHVWTTTSDSFKVGALSSYNTTMVEADSGDTVFTPISASGSFSAEVTNTIVAGGNPGAYSVTTKDEPVVTDTMPDFIFTDISEVPINSSQTTYAVFSDADSTFHVSSADSFKIGVLGTWRKDGYQEEAESGDTVYLSKVASGINLTSVDVVVTAGGYSDTWTITTEPQPDPPIGDNWYVSNIGKGDSTGSSWANSMYIGSLNGSFVEAGDTVYIDGGTDSLVYSSSRSFDGTAVCLITADGTADNKIVYTRGRDVGHNGVPIFSQNSAKMPFYILAASYVELSYVKIIPAHRIPPDKYQHAIKVEYGNHIDVLHNEIDYTYGTAIWCASSNNMHNDYRIMYNTLYAQPQDTNWWAGDGIKLNGVEKVEIAYNVIRNRLNMDKLKTGQHRDLIQSYYVNQSTGDTLKIHHNFLGSVMSTDNNAGVSAMYLNGAYGIHLIYNNIFDMYNSMENITVRSESFASNSKVFYYNNIFNLKSSSTDIIWFYYIDSVYFKNNLVKSDNSSLIQFRDGVTGYGLAFDYNRYDIPAPNYAIVAGYTTFALWQSGTSQDANSTAGEVSMIDPSSYDPADFRYNRWSRGIDEGTTIDIFDDDYSGTTRPINGVWDIGAYESSIYEAALLRGSNGKPVVGSDGKFIKVRR